MSLIRANTILGPGSKLVKFYKEAITAIEGANTAVKLDLCDIRVGYDQYIRNSFVLGKSVQNKKIDIDNLGLVTTFLVIKPKYDIKNKDITKNYLHYALAGEPGISKYFSSLLILSGTPEKPIPDVYVSNPNDDYVVKLEIFACTTEYDATPTNSDYDVIIAGLAFNDVRTLNIGESIAVYNGNNQIMLTININNIENITLEDMNVILDDSANGTVALEFATEYDARQLMSALSWLLNLPDERSIPQPADNIAPVITVTDVVVSGAAPDTDLADYPSGFTASDAITLCIDTVVDARDGVLNPEGLIVEFKKNGQIYDIITTAGTYYMTFKATDTAGNTNIITIVITLT